MIVYKITSIVSLSKINDTCVGEFTVTEFGD